MLAYTTYSEAGGVGKTTSAANLARAHARGGFDVLVIGLDPQEGDLSHLLDVDEDRTKETDNLVRHMIRRPKGDFDDLIRSVEGFDVIPEHNMLASLDEYLRREKEQAESLGEAFGMRMRLHRVLRENDISDRYDVLIVDPPATEGPHLYNAVAATRSLVIPIEPSAKGQQSVRGLEDLVEGLEDELDVMVGVLAAVPMGVKHTADQTAVLEQLKYPTPVVIGDRTSLMEGCWQQQCTAFEYVRNHRQRRRDYEIETLAKFDELARHLEDRANLKPRDPPEPGDLTADAVVTV